MPIQLDKILAGICDEKVLHPNCPDASKKDIDDAWTRVGKNNKLSVHETRSIFKVLQKKYQQEKEKEIEKETPSSWKLFSIMDEIHRKIEISPPPSTKAEDVAMEEEEVFEMLEVQEEDDTSVSARAHSNCSVSDSESPNKPLKTANSSVKKEEKILLKSGSIRQISTASDEKKLLNTMVSATPRQPLLVAAAQNAATATAAALHKKGITLKKTTPITRVPASVNISSSVRVRPTHSLEFGKTIQLPDSIKRKLSEDEPVMPATKKTNLTQSAAPIARQVTPSQSISTVATTNLQPPQLLKKPKAERGDDEQEGATHGLNVITIPGNLTRNDLSNGGGGGGPSSSTAATVASTSTNGFSPRIEDLDFRNDIIIDGSGLNGSISAAGAGHKLQTNAAEIINLGNFDNMLPPTFFKNLCNSSRHEALGLYVANVMNRLSTRSAAKLELGILRAIIDVQSDDLEQ